MLEISNELLSQTFTGNEWPVFRDVEQIDEIINLQLMIPDNLSYFAGHFPEQAVLPLSLIHI